MNEEIERILAADLFENEYNGSQLEQRAWLSKAAAKRIIELLTKKGYVIQKAAEPKA
jgi:DNA-binding MarR family transcriptional regulator